MTLHYSIQFKDSYLPNHGEVKYPISAYQNYDKYTESMIALVKADLSKKLPKWGETPDKMLKAEFYFHRGPEEIIFFKWEKEN